jgi:hypothetical protein
MDTMSDKITHYGGCVMANSPTARLILAVIVAFVTASLAAIPSFALDCAPGAAMCFAAGEACGNFGVQIEISPSAHRVSHEFFDKNGNLVRVLSAGKGDALTFTNLSSGATLATKPNGSVWHDTYNPDGSTMSVSTGHNVIILFPTDVPPGPSTTLYVGQVVYSVDTDGVWTIMKASGTKVDICAALSH